MAKHKTNDQLLRALVKDICESDILFPVVLRERLMTISKITRADIKKNPKPYDNPIMNHTYYLAVCDKIDKHLNVD